MQASHMDNVPDHLLPDDGDGDGPTIMGECQYKLCDREATIHQDEPIDVVLCSRHFPATTPEMLEGVEA